MPKILHLNLKREYFDAIARGEKHTEYRRRTPYWRTRLEGKQFDLIKFRNGYMSDAPEMLIEFNGIRQEGSGRSAPSRPPLSRPTADSSNGSKPDCILGANGFITGSLLYNLVSCPRRVFLDLRR